MSDKRVFFASGNVEKLADVREVVGRWPGIRVDHYDLALEELQISDLKPLLEDKLVRAFRGTRQPTIVDHACLSLDALGGFPGTSAGAFWAALGDNVCDIVGKLGNTAASVIVGLGYTDGINVHIAIKDVRGSIASTPRGLRQFDWDRIFIPTGSTKTYAEMSTSEKNNTSPRAKAFRELKKYI